MYIIANDGTGDFSSIQSAVDAMPTSNCEPITLLLRAGEYRERVIINKDNLRIVGESRQRSVIVHSGCARDLDADGRERGTFLSYTMLVTGDSVELENLTVINDAGDGHEVGQAIAVYAAGDRGVYRNVNMLAHQDTLFCGPTNERVCQDALPRAISPDVRVENLGDCPHVKGRLYFEGCYIRGDVDFIFGPYRCWFERCTLYMNARGGYYTAANTPEASLYGFVFNACTLTGGCVDGAGFLGRPWRAYARTVFIDCDMDEHVSPQGFSDWDDDKPVTERYGEYGTRGARADQSPRHPKQKRLSAAEASALTIDKVLDGWLPRINK